MSLRQLQAVFDRSHTSTSFTQTLPIQKTSVGIWVPTPLEVIDAAGGLLKDRGWLDASQPGHLLDAGTGDGRVGMLLSRLDATRVVYGIEHDPRLYDRARENLEKLGEKGLIDPDLVQIVEGNYCDVSTYRGARIAMRQTHLIFNYPDGNQQQLGQFIMAHAGAQTKLCLLSHDRTLDLDELRLEDRFDVGVSNEPEWRLSVYGIGKNR